MYHRRKRDLTILENRLNDKIHIGSIQAFEEHIREHEMAIIKLKRARNSLLNVSRLPPEILGNIFSRNVAFKDRPKSSLNEEEGWISKDTFGGLEERSHNFLLVCHRWFEVSSRTPEVWSFWGNNLQDWKKLHPRYPTAPVDLVLDGELVTTSDFDDVHQMRHTLQDRAEKDKIRRIHIKSKSSELLKAILAFTSGGEIRPSSVESIVIINEDEDVLTDISDFFIHHRFPKLHHFMLDECQISSWDVIVGRTSALTTLHLGLTAATQHPTTSQLFSILSSNPSLRELCLGLYTLPYDTDKSSSRVSLTQLDKLELAGPPKRVFDLLRRLDHPTNMRRLELDLHPCQFDDVPGIIGPYIREYLHRHPKSRSGLGLSVSDFAWNTSVQIGNVSGMDSFQQTRMETFVELSFGLENEFETERATLDIISCISREEICYLQVYGSPMMALGDMSIRLPHLKALHVGRYDLDATFPDPTSGMDQDIFPSLRRITLEYAGPIGSDWVSLTTFLHRRAFSGNRLDLLETIGIHPTYPGVEEDIRSVVREFRRIVDKF